MFKKETFWAVTVQPSVAQKFRRQLVVGNELLLHADYVAVRQWVTILSASTKSAAGQSPVFDEFSRNPAVVGRERAGAQHPGDLVVARPCGTDLAHHVVIGGACLPKRRGERPVGRRLDVDCIAARLQLREAENSNIILLLKGLLEFTPLCQSAGSVGPRRTSPE